MHRYFTSLCVLAGLLLVAAQASATLSDYSFSVTSGSQLSVDNNIWQGRAGSRDDGSVTNVVTGLDLPFAFKFDGTDYRRISVSSNGLVGFGNTDVTADGYNSLTGYGEYPVITAWWDYLKLTGGAQSYCSKSPSISYGVNGNAPNRIFVIEWRDVEVAERYAAFSTFQVRLYEGSNLIEFWYDMTSQSCVYWMGSQWNYTSATIGAATSSSDFMSIIPDYSGAYAERSWVNDYIDLSYEPYQIPQNTVYQLAPCNVNVTGNIADGGTMTMTNGDTLLRGMTVQRGDMGSFQPLWIENYTGGCGGRNFTIDISGPDASEFSLDMTGGYLNNGESVFPTITFAPTANGVRRAILTITDDNFYTHTYPLAATATTRINWIPNMADGATPALADGDTLFTGIIVPRTTTRDFRPMTIENFNTNPEATPAQVSITLDSEGTVSTQYQLIGATTASLAAGESFVPVVRFTGSGVGVQEARLTVTADEITRVYTLRAISGAPAIEVTANGIAVNDQNPAMNLTMACVGNVATSVPFVVTNIGTLPLVVNDIKFYLTDTTIRQGAPPFPLDRTASGGVVPARDYMISDVPGGAPITGVTPATVPFTLGIGATRTLYLTFVGQEPGKRFGRVFIRTNAENIFGVDTNAYDNVTSFPNVVTGLFTTDLTARAVGSKLAANLDGLRLTTIVFPHTRVGDTSTMAFTIANTGACEMRINRNKLRMSSGDVNEFKLMTSLRNASFDQATGDYLLAPGTEDTLFVRFTPSRAGTRMATLWIQSNDSTILNPGIAERGAAYVDMHGRGLAGLDGHDLVLDPVVIGGSVDGTVSLENTLTVAVVVDRILFSGGEEAEFSAVNWPVTPAMVLPGQKLNLTVRMTPVGIAGTRRTTLFVITNGGDTARIQIRGEAGTQTLVVSPTSLFDDVTIGIGQAKRQTLKISNNGTLPVRITGESITGIDASSYRLGAMPRRDLEAGQTEYLEVTFVPSAPGQTSAQIEITASNGQTYTVALGGNALRTRRDPADPSGATPAPATGIDAGKPADRMGGGLRPTLR